MNSWRGLALSFLKRKKELDRGIRESRSCLLGSLYLNWQIGGGGNAYYCGGIVSSLHFMSSECPEGRGEASD